MECLQCQNCNEAENTYFCVAKNELIIDSSKIMIGEKVRNGWKKGDPRYEVHRRKLRKEAEM